MSKIFMTYRVYNAAKLAERQESMKDHLAYQDVLTREGKIKSRFGLALSICR